MRRFLLISLCLAGSASLFAQWNGDGYYRIQNAHTGRYMSVINNKVDDMNKDFWQVANTGAHIYALQTKKSMSNIVSDPGSILYIASGSDGYILRGQGMDTKELTSGRYLKIYNSRTTAGAYWLYASESGTAVYLKDKDDILDSNNNTGYTLASTSRSEAEIDWKILPIDQASQYFAITPEVSISNKHYATIYAGFPFELSAGMKAYYVNSIENENVELAEFAGTVIPAATPVIIECSSADPANNKVKLLTGQYGTIQGNLLKGIYFSYVMMSIRGGEATTDLAKQLRNVIPYNEETMRVIGEVDGNLGFVKATDMTYLPANKAYLTVPAKTADGISAVYKEPEQVKSGVFTLTGIRLNEKSNTEGLPKGIYIVNGKKVVIR